MIRKIRIIILTVSFFSLLLSCGIGKYIMSPKEPAGSSGRRPVSWAHAQEQAGNITIKESGNTQVSSPSLDTYEDKLKFWQSLTDEQRQAIRERARKISPEQMRAFREKLDEFRKFSPDAAERIKTNYERFKQMHPEKRSDLERRYQRFQRLPEERKIELRRMIQQRIKSGDKKYLFKDKETQGSLDSKTGVLDLNKNRKQSLRDIINKKLENRNRFINLRRSRRR